MQVIYASIPFPDRQDSLAPNLMLSYHLHCLVAEISIKHMILRIKSKILQNKEILDDYQTK